MKFINILILVKNYFDRFMTVSWPFKSVPYWKDAKERLATLKDAQRTLQA